MARYTGPKARRWRRLGQVPSDGSVTAVGRRNYPPGQHGLKRQSRPSEYANQMREKQKARYTFGLQERQFAGYYRKADQQNGVTGDNLMRLLEMRLDNVVYRLGLAKTRSQARQLVGHGHIAVGGRKVDLPSYQVVVNDTIGFTERGLEPAKKRLDSDSISDLELPGWLKLDRKTLTGTVMSVPERAELDSSINEQLIIEFYSR